VAYTTEFYTKANLVDADSVDTGFVDIRSVNWLKELVEEELWGRLTPALFGDVKYGHVVRHPDQWVNTSQTPALIWSFLKPVESANQGSRMAFFSELYGDDPLAQKYFEMRRPRVYDLPVRLVVKTGDKYPPYDVEMKLLSLFTPQVITVAGQEIEIAVDAPLSQTWAPRQSDVLVSFHQVVYRRVPLIVFDELYWGSVLLEGTLDLIDEALYDRTGVEEVVREITS